MQVQEMITTAGGVKPNEDRVGRSGALAWVIDGTTDLYDDAVLPAERDVHWLVDVLGDLLTAAGADGYRGPTVPLLERAAETIRRQQETYGFPSDRLPPACSIAVLVDRGDTFEIARVGDATAVIDGGGEARVVATDFFDRREGAAVQDRLRRGTTAAQVRVAMLDRRSYTMTAGDVESVFSGHPRRQLRIHTTVRAWADAERVLLCTDGFARLVSDYRLYPHWGAVIADAGGYGLAYLEKQIRDAERDPASDGGTRFKRADDAAAILLLPDAS